MNSMTRRAAISLLPAGAAAAPETQSPQVVRLGGGWCLFLDETLIERKENVRLVMHRPELREPVILADRPWQRKLLHYSCVVQDGGRYRMWYRGTDGDPKVLAKTDRDWSCYAESRDGIHWEFPNLGLVRYEGADTNIFLPAEQKGINPSIIVDAAAPPAERYKMILRTRTAIEGYVSPDGLRWKPVPGNPLLTEGPFDSHNILIRDGQTGRYVIYLRGVDRSVPGPFFGGRRAIRRSESTDFQRWSAPRLVVAPDDGDPVNLHLYTNAALQYDRAPDAWVMFPMVLYVGRRAPAAPLDGSSDVQFAASRDGIVWERRFREAIIAPGPDERNWVDRNPIVGQGLLHTARGEMSMYYSDLYRSPASRIRRATWRTDGFVSVEAPYRGGEFVTRPLLAAGSGLELNCSTTGGGSIQVEVQDAGGRPLPQRSLADSPMIFGDSVEFAVPWARSGPAPWNGRPVRLRFRMRDANLYSFRFTP